MKPRCVIVVPLYQSTLTEDEQTSLKRLEHITTAPKCIVAPTGWVAPPALQHWQVETFAPHFFEGIQGYNRLMLSEDFYQRFTPYDYLLIHQADAFLFRDEIDKWCEKGYSYIGAPWLIKRKYQGWGRVLLHLRALPKRLRRKPFLPLDFGNKVGNGGLSLRNIQDFLSICQSQREEIDRWLQLSETCREYNEDCFWASRPQWTYPTWQEALRFSMDLDPKDAIEQNHHQLPMGCHGWNKTHYKAFWWPYIQAALND